MANAVTTVANIAGTAVGVPAVGTIADGIGAFFSSLNLFKGKTQHVSYDLAYPRAQSYGRSLYGDFVTAYGASVDFIKGPGTLPLWNEVQADFIVAWGHFWGNAHPIGIPVRQELNTIYTATAGNNAPGLQPLAALCQLYWLWIIMGVDANGGQGALEDTINATFDMIFFPAILKVGLDKQKLLQGNQVTTKMKVTLGGTVSQDATSGTTSPGTKLASLGPAGVVLGIGAAVGAIYMLSQSYRGKHSLKGAA